MNRKLRIAIDGPSGAGKSTLARAVARALGLPYVDTGAMYRAVAWAALERGAETPAGVEALLADLEMELVTDPDGFRVRIGRRELSAELRDPDVGRRASLVAQIPAVRRWLVERQRAAAAGGAVLEGRDIGTVVLPDADLKLFVTAPEEVRMRRRAEQLGTELDERVLEDIRERDRRDRERELSPLPESAAPDAVLVDTGADTPQRSLARILEIVRTTTG